MKKFFKPIFLGLAALTVFIIAGCASAATLMSRGDNVGAIEKLASQLKKKPNDQESADMFVSLYPSEVENRLQYTERNVPDIINEWVTSQGYNSLPSALAARKKAVGSSTFLADDSEIRHLITDMETTQKNLKDLEKIQKAVVSMPYEIGEYDVYFVEKYSDNFSGMAQIADRSMAEFYYELGNAAAPGANRTQKIALFDLYGKVNLYSTGYGNISAKRAEAAYAVAEDYLAGSTIDEKKEAINWFNKANNIVTNYNDTNTRIREANYQIGLLYILKWADADLDNANTIIANEYQIRSDMENAIKYLEASKSYKDASTHIANCRKVLAALDEMHNTSRAAAGTTDSGTTNTGTTNSGTTNTGSTNTSTNTGTTTTTTAKPMLLVADTASFTLGSNNKINAAVKVTAQGDISLSAGNISFVSNTAGATVKNITVLKAIDTSFTKYKKRDLSAKTTGYTINFELSKAGSFIFRVADAKGAKVEMSLADGTTDTLSPTYTLSDAKYKELIPSTQTTTPTPSTPTTTVKAPVVLVDSNPKYSVVNKKVNATVNIAVEGDLSVTANNIKFDANTAGATVKSVAPTKAVDTSLTKIQTPVKTKGETTKVTGYTITFELSKAGQIVFRVLDAKGGKVQHNATNGNKDTCSPLYTLTEAEYNKLIPPAVTPTPSTPVATKPTMVVDSAPKYSVVSNKVNAALNVIVVGDLALTKDNIKLSTNTAGATVKSVTAQKAVDATLSKSKPLASLKATAKTTGYVITFELAKAGNYSFGVIPSTTAKSATQIEIASIDGKTGTVSPTYTLTEAEYKKLIPPAVTPTPTPVAKPSVLVSNTANYSVVSSKVNATVNIVVLGDLSLTKDNIKLSTNTAGATVKSIGVQNSIDAALSKAPSLNTKQKTAQKTTPYQITFELTKAGNFSFNVVDSTTVKNPGQVSIVTLEGKTGTVSPTYTLTEAEYNKIVPKPSAIIYKEGSYSTTAAEYIIPFTLENYSSPISMNEINVTKNTTGGTVTVSGTASNAQLIIRNITKSGTFFFTYKDRNTGNVMPRSKAQGGTAITEYTIDINKVWTKPSLQFFKKSSSHYPTYEPVVRFPFEVTGLTYYLSKNNINVASNVCGAVWNLEHDNVSSLGRNTAVKYYIVLSDIKKSGDFTYSVLDNAGKVITSNTNQTTDTFTVDIDKVFAQSVMYNDSIFFSKTGEANTNFNVYGMSTDRQVKHIKIVTNTTGATVKSVTRSDNGRLSYMRVYDIVFTGIKSDGVISFYVLDDAGKNLAVVHSVNGDEISAPTRNPTTNDIVKYNVKVQNIKSAHQLVYGSAPGYSTEKGQVTIPFTLKPSGTAPAFTASNVVVLTNGTGGTVSSVKSLGTNSYIVVLDNVTKSGTFQYRLKDANGYTITPEGFKNSGGATHSSAASPAYSIDHTKVADGTSNLRVAYDTGVTYPTTLGTAKVTFTVSDPAAATVSKTVSKTSPKDLTSVTPPTAGAPIAGIAAATPTTLKMSNVQVLTNGTGGTPSLTHLGSGKYEIVLSNVTKSGIFQFQLKDNGGRLIVHPNFTGTPNTILSPAYSININSVAAGKIKTADKVVYASENNNVVVQVPLTAEGGIVLKQSDFALVTNTCGAKIIRLDRTGTTAKYTLVLSVTKAGKFSFSVTSGSTTPTVYCDADAKYMRKAATKNVSVEFEVSVANGGTLQQKLELLEQVDPFKPATMLDLNSMLQKGTSVNGALQLKDTSGNVYTLKNDTASKDMQRVQERIEADGVLKADALKDKVKR